jgi:hypothetical protein
VFARLFNGKNAVRGFDRHRPTDSPIRLAFQKLRGAFTVLLIFMFIGDEICHDISTPSPGEGMR